MHRLEDFLIGKDSLCDDDKQNIYQFIDLASHFVGLKKQPDSEKLQKLISDLPGRGNYAMDAKNLHRDFGYAIWGSATFN